MNDVTLTPQMADYVEAQVASGAFADASEVLRAGLRLLMERDGTVEALRRRAALVAALIEGEESGPGEPFDVEAFLTEQTWRSSRSSSSTHCE